MAQAWTREMQGALKIRVSDKLCRTIAEAAFRVDIAKQAHTQTLTSSKQ